MNRQQAAAQQIESAKLTNVFSLVSNWTTLKKVTGSEWHGPCPVCGGTDRFHVNTRGNFCGCRKCDRRWDAVGIYAVVHRISPGQAAREILGVSTAKGQRKVTKIEPAKKEEVIVRGPEWQTEARATIDKATESLFSTDHPQGLEYLTKRGFEVETLRAFQIGFDHAKFHPMMQRRKPAIVIPWVVDEEIQAVKYRFLDVGHKERFSQKGGSTPLVFGMQNLRRHDRLVVIEGDMNAKSSWQVINGESDVLSVGSEASNTGLDLVVQIAENRGYDFVSCWYDDLGRAKKACAHFSCRAVPLYSRMKLDANDVLTKFGAETLLEILREAFTRREDICPRCLGKRYEIIGKGLQRICPDCGGSK